MRARDWNVIVVSAEHSDGRSILIHNFNTTLPEDDAPPQKTTVNIRMTETFLDDVDGTWKELGYNSRSEFVRDIPKSDEIVDDPWRERVEQ